MPSIHEELQDLFYEDLMLSGSEIVKSRIQTKQQSLQKWGADLIPEGLHHMRVMLQNINANSKGDIGDSLREFDWELGEDPYMHKLMKGELTEEDRKNRTSKMHRFDTPSISQINRVLYSCMSLLGPVIDELGDSANKAITSCLWLNDYQMATLAGLLLHFENFRHFRDIRNIRARLKISRQMALRLELCVLLYSSGSHDELKAEIVPNILPNKELLELNLSEDKKRRNIWIFIDDLIVWDIATDGLGPRQRWPNWWV